MRAEARTVAYVTKAFPRATETFIAHEVHLLETMGLPIRIYSIKPGELSLRHEVLDRIRADIVTLPATESLSAQSLARWLRTHWRLFGDSQWRLLRDHPGRYLRTLAKALWMSWRHRKPGSALPRKVFIKEFLQAGRIAADVLARGDVGHLHGHFCHGATTVTWFVGDLCNLDFSFTAHAKDIYEPAQNPRGLLARKLRAARFVATCTDANRRHLLALVGDAPVHTIYHGLDPEFFRPDRRSAGAANDTPLVLAVGRVTAKKGFIDLVEACAQLRANGIAFRCEIVGEQGDASAALAAALQRLGLEDGSVRLLPAMPQQHLRAHYRRAAIFVLPCLVTDSGDRDGIPNVLAEAMASGVPVVSTPISGIPELVRDGVDGLLVPAQDPAALATAIARLLADQALRRTFGAAARDRICEIFDARRTTCALHRLLQDARGESARGVA
ncbi:MAG: glycosyltransferase family 4 protein [Gammaproteobacteria bacterium]